MMFTDSVKQKLGPVIVDIEGLRLSPQDRDLLMDPLVGGLIFFSRNYQSLSQLQALVREIRELRPNLLLTVDQEGGRVQRFKSGFTRLPPMQAFWQQSKGEVAAISDFVRDCGWLMASEILACDIDLSFAPVLDVDDKSCAVISDRSFSPDPQQVAVLGKAFIDGMHEAGMASTGKHFPGHGSVVEDSHLSLPVDNRPFEHVLEKDWIPFAKLSQDLDAIMPAHLVFPAIDDVPVGFSSIWLQEKLKGNLGFKGLIFSDDLTMEGAAKAGGYGTRAEMALKAGCDSVLVCNNREGALEILARLRKTKFEIDDRLSSMKMRKTITWDSLKASERWQSIQKKISELLNKIKK